MAVPVPRAGTGCRNRAHDLPIARERVWAGDQNLAALSAHGMHHREGPGGSRKGEKGATDHAQRYDSLEHLNLLTRTVVVTAPRTQDAPLALQNDYVPRVRRMAPWARRRHSAPSSRPHSRRRTSSARVS